jgi:carboxypeptidase family protein
MRRLSRLAPLIVAVATLSNAAILPAQPAPVIHGRVVRADDPAVPVPRARISLNGVGPADRVFADDQGRFEIAMAAASATLTASKPGFATATFRLPSRRSPDPIEIPLMRGAALTGRVIDPSGQPVLSSGVRVRRIDQALPADPGRVPVSAVTNDRGEFRLGGLAPGSYELFASFVYDPKEQFESDIAPSALLVAGMPRPSPESVQVTVQAGEELFVTLNHREPGTAGAATPDSAVSGAINGIVVDDFGDPVQGLRVRLWQTSVADGRRVLTTTFFSHPTDDRGQYRAYRVPPGRYFVSVDDPAGVLSEPKLTADMPVFYPRTVTPAEALEIEIGPQQEMAGVNVVFNPRRQARVRGFVVNAAGQPHKATVTLMTAFRAGEPSMPARTAASNQTTGAFEFENVAPGDYVLRVNGQGPGNLPGIPPVARPGSAPAEFGAQRIWVRGDDPAPITVRTSPPSSIAGRIEFEGKPAGMDLRQISIMAVPEDPDTAPGVRQATVKAGQAGNSDWSFEVTGVAGPVRLAVKAPAPWWLKSLRTGVIHSPDELLDLGTTTGAQGDLTLVLAASAASVSGRVQADRLQSDNIVIVFPTEERLWFNRSPYIRMSEPGTNTRFTLAGIPPGEYFIAAVNVNSGQKLGEWWTDRETLLALQATAQRVALSEGQSARTELPLVPATR